MAYEEGIATSKEDFIDQFFTFLAANGWTVDDFNTATNRGTVHQGTVFVTFRWDDLGTGGIAVFQGLGYKQQAVSATVAAGGTGYEVNDQLVVSGGTFGVAAVFNVDSVSGGAVTAVSLVTPGDYTVTPANPAETTGGTFGSSGAELNVTYQSVSPSQHVQDSGNGDDSGAIDEERRMSDIGGGPYSNHYFFTGDEDGAFYAYAVLEYSPGRFSAVGFGELVKFGTWTGGEWCGAVSYDSAFGPADSRHNYFTDGRGETVPDAATVHVEDLPGQDPSGVWGVVTNNTATGTDTNGNPRALISGGTRESFISNALQGMAANPNSGFVPMYPAILLYRFGSGGVDWRYLGQLPHFRELNGTHLIAAEEFVVGGVETWKVFPYTRKADSGTPHSGNIFFAVRKIV